MGRSIIGLIQASGYTGAANESFRNNVRGAADGASVAGYILEAWTNWASSNYVQGAQYANGAYLDFTFDMTAGSWFYHLRDYNLPTPASLSVHVYGGIDASLQEIQTGAEVIPVAGANSAWDANVGSIRYQENKIRVQLFGDPVTVGTTLNGANITKNWYAEYDYPETIPPDASYNVPQDDREWTITVTPSTSPSGGTTHGPVYFKFIYPQDAGSFNPELVSPAFNVEVAKRVTQQGLEYQWSDYSNFSNTISTISEVTFWSSYGDGSGTTSSGYKYLRYRPIGSSTWTNFGSGANPDGSIYWADVRWHSWNGGV